MVLIPLVLCQRVIPILGLFVGLLALLVRTGLLSVGGRLLGAVGFCLLCAFACVCWISRAAGSAGSQLDDKAVSSFRNPMHVLDAI